MRATPGGRVRTQAGSGPAGGLVRADAAVEGLAGGLAARDVVVHYRDEDGTTATAVDRVSLDVAPGEVVALLGPSGSGKSSLLRAVAGLEPIAAGTIRWAGLDVAGVPVHRRGFGLMFQDGQLFPHRDVAGNVAYGLEMARMPRAEQRERVTELLEVVGLAGFEHREVATLSGGERQRVALARSLAPRPRLLLLDEPLSALDRALRERLAGEVRAALTATGTTAIFVTHDHDEAFAVADRIAVLDLGRLLQVAPPADLWRHPASRRVAEFLGYEAFVPATSPLSSLLLPPLPPLPSPTSEEAVAGAATSSDASAGGGEEGAGRGEGTDGGWGDGAWVALGPGSLVRDDGGALRGRVVGQGFRRGITELVVDVEGIGEVTVVEPSRPPSAAAESTVGDLVRLRPDPATIAVIPA